MEEAPAEQEWVTYLLRETASNSLWWIEADLGYQTFVTGAGGARIKVWIGPSRWKIQVTPADWVREEPGPPNCLRISQAGNPDLVIAGPIPQWAIYRATFFSLFDQRIDELLKIIPQHFRPITPP